MEEYKGDIHPLDRVQNPNFDATKVATVENPHLKSTAEKPSLLNRIKNLTHKFPKEQEDPVDLIRRREAKLSKNNPDANLDERIDQ